MPRTLIAGGGIAGLTAAHALLAAGHDVLVLESHNSIRGSGAVLGIWPPHMAIFERFGLADDISANSINGDQWHLWSRSGEPLRGPSFAEVTAGYRLPYSTIYRPLLNRIIAEPLGDRVRTDSTVIGYAEHRTHVEVRLADGRIEEADLLVAADGIGSRIRGQMHPTAVLVDTEQVAWRGVVDPGSVSLPPRHGFVVGAARSRGGWLRVAGGQVFWVVARFGISGPAPVEVKAEALAQVDYLDDGTWGFPLRELIKLTKADEIHRDAIAEVPPLQSWVTSYVALIGDAAHATSPHISSGAAYAIEDAFVLGTHLAESGDVGGALRAYDLERRERMAWVRANAQAVSKLALGESADYGAAWVKFVGASLASAPVA